MMLNLHNVIEATSGADTIKALVQKASGAGGAHPTAAVCDFGAKTIIISIVGFCHKIGGVSYGNEHRSGVSASNRAV